MDNTSASAAWERSYAWPPDPMWTESNWPPNTPTVNVFQEESDTVGGDVSCACQCQCRMRIAVP